MFGNNNANSSTNNGGTSFQFGSSNTNNQTAPAAGGFSFGSNNAPANNANTGSGFSFGGNNNTGAGVNKGFSFGGSATTNTTTGASSGGFGFGNNANNANKPSGFSFGNTASNSSTTGARRFSAGAAPTGTAGGFGFNKPAAPVAPAAPTAPAGTNSGFSFGNKPAFGNTTTTNTTSMFGSNQQTPQLQLGQQPQQTQQHAGFTSQPGFAWSNSQNQPTQPLAQTQVRQQQQPPNGYTPTINDQLEKIKNSWDASSPQCIMKTHFYNKVPQEFNNYQRPPDESPEDWESAMKERPKNYNSIPVKATGFEDLLKRSNLQIDYIKQSRVVLNQINDNLVKLGDKHDLHSTSILLKCKMKQKELDIKLLRIAINLSILKYKGYPLTNDEERLVLKFKQLLEQIDDPTGLNRSNELWARLSNLKQRLNSMETNKASVKAEVTESKSAELSKDSGVIGKVVKVLSKQQQGIQCLYELIEGDKEVMAKKV